jgi:hypothetical protein
MEASNAKHAGTVSTCMFFNDRLKSPRIFELNREKEMSLLLHASSLWLKFFPLKFDQRNMQLQRAVQLSKVNHSHWYDVDSQQKERVNVRLKTTGMKTF